MKTDYSKINNSKYEAKQPDLTVSVFSEVLELESLGNW